MSIKFTLLLTVMSVEKTLYYPLRRIEVSKFALSYVIFSDGERLHKTYHISFNASYIHVYLTRNQNMESSQEDVRIQLLNEHDSSPHWKN